MDAEQEIYPSDAKTVVLPPETPAVISDPAGRTGASEFPAGATTLEPGCVVRNLRILNRLSEGGMGELWLCHPLEEVGVRRVLKVLKQETAASADGRARFRREGHLLLRFRHENIVRTYDAWSEGDSEFILMEYVSGMDLGRMVRAHCEFTAEYGVYMLQVLAETFGYAWDTLRLLHRDIKPSNIMISDDNVLKVLDFGVAKSLEQNGGTVITMAGMTLGSPGFMSPEQCFSPEKIGCSSDIFSLGATVYYCLSGGALPYPGGNLPEIVAAMRKGKPPPLCRLNPAIPRQLSELVMAMVAANPEQRPSSWEELLSAIARCGGAV